MTVQEPITDHTEHIDLARSRAAHSFQTVSDEINQIRGLVATVESDTRRVMELADRNDVSLKASIASVVELLGSSIGTVRSDIELKIRDTQTAVQKLHETVSQRPPQLPRQNSQQHRLDCPSTTSLRH